MSFKTYYLFDYILVKYTNTQFTIVVLSFKRFIKTKY